jgi:L-threonylcarbamoyladenylate synthase
MTAVNAFDEARTQRALELLRSGGVVVLPTDTLPGFHAAASRREAVERISALKGVTGPRQYLLLAASIDMVSEYVASWGCASRETLAGIWPAPLTVILPAGGRTPEWVGETVALRVPRLEPLCSLIEQLGEAFVSTSCNRSGEPPMRDYEIIGGAFDVDMVLTGPAKTGPASTLVDASGKTAVVLREGPYDWAAATGESKPSK